MTEKLLSSPPASQEAPNGDGTFRILFALSQKAKEKLSQKLFCKGRLWNWIEFRELLKKQHFFQLIEFIEFHASLRLGVCDIGQIKQ